MARPLQHWHRIEVTGRGKFPIDMLRYDQCFPLYDSDTEIMRHPINEPQIVALGHWGPSSWKPTASRWKGYHWTVTHHEVMR
jgi:hypothetical protein